MDIKRKKDYKTLTWVLILNIISFAGNTTMFALSHTGLAWMSFGFATLSLIVLILVLTHMDAYIREK